MATPTPPPNCVKDTECTSLEGYKKGCCMKFDPGSVDKNLLSMALLPTTAGKFCASDGYKVALDLYAA